MNVENAMSKHTYYCTHLDNVYEAAIMMKEYHTDVIPVMENEKIIGIVTERDLVVRGIAEKKPNSHKITEIISLEIKPISPSDDLDQAIAYMAEKQIFHLPVVENQQLVGILTSN